LHTLTSTLFAALLVWLWWTASSRRGSAAMAAALWAPAGMLLAVGLNQPLGNRVHEPRPYTSLQQVEVLVAVTLPWGSSSEQSSASSGTSSCGASSSWW
jgi:hypothetical protein